MSRQSDASVCQEWGFTRSCRRLMRCQTAHGSMACMTDEILHPLRLPRLYVGPVGQFVSTLRHAYKCVSHIQQRRREVYRRILSCEFATRPRRIWEARIRGQGRSTRLQRCLRVRFLQAQHAVSFPHRQTLLSLSSLDTASSHPRYSTCQLACMEPCLVL
jgi:hypothetical protein